jgi:4-hydroxybenzoate polyprenyltransferase
MSLAVSSVSRWREYLAERFPVPVTLLLAAATAAAASVVAQAPGFAAGDGGYVVDLSDVGAGVALMFLLLFHLRVFDEHKDFEQDRATRPDRPVQRGLVTLGQLKVAGAIAIGLEIAIAVAAFGADAVWWALPLGYSVLMLVEFGAKRWLERHYTVYALSHSAITSAVCVALVMMADPGFGAPSFRHVVILAVLALASTFAIDVLRKTWAPSSEIDGVETWSKLLGPSLAAALGVLLIASASVSAGWLGWEAGGRWGWIGFVAAVTLWALVTIRGFAADPTPKREKMLQVVAGVHYLAVWIGVAAIAAIALGGGVVR